MKREEKREGGEGTGGKRERKGKVNQGRKREERGKQKIEG